MRRALPLLAVLLAGCAPDLPRADGAARARVGPYPALLPLDPILIESRRPPRAAEAQVELRARGDALAGTAIAPPEAADVAARGEALRARAARLRDAPL